HGEGGELAGDLAHIGDHQQQPLGGGEGGGEGAGLERAVHRAGGAALRLHLSHQRHGAPDVAPALGAPLVGELAHVRGGGDGVDGDHFVDAVGDRGGGLV